MRSLPFLLIACLTLLFMIGGAEADEPLQLYSWSANWNEVDNEPPEVGDGALEVAWNQTGVGSGTFSVSIVGMSGYDPEASSIENGTTVTWTNDDTITHTVTDKDSQFDSFDIAPGNSWSREFNEVGTYNYYCKYHPMMEGSITVLSDILVNERVQTDFTEVWTSQSYLVFWANFSMSDGDSIEIVAEKWDDNNDGTYPLESIHLNEDNGFSIVSNGIGMGDSLIGNTSGEWKKYQIYLSSQKLGYDNFNYDPHEDNRYRFFFSVRGIEGSAAIGGVQLIQTLDTGFYFGKGDDENLQYDIFPELNVEIDYFAKNIGTEDNTFRITPEVIAQGMAYDGAAFSIYVMVRMNGEAFDSIDATQNDDGTWTYEFDMASDDEAVITIRVTAPDYDTDSGEPADNRKFDVVLNAYDTGSTDELREPVGANLFIKPSQFVLGEIWFNRFAVLEGDSLEITAQVWNEGNWATDVLVVFYILDEEGTMYSTPDGNLRMTRVASTTVPYIMPVDVLEYYNVWRTWYRATATWDVAFMPNETGMDYEEVEIYAQINPQPEQQDIDAGHTWQDEYLMLREDNGGFANLWVVDKTGATPQEMIESESVKCLFTGYDIALQSSVSLASSGIEGCSDDTSTISLIASEDGSGVWTIQIVKVSPQTSVFSAKWWLLDDMGFTKTDGLVSDVYGYYSGYGEAVIFIDNDFNGKLSPGDKFEIHPGEYDSKLASVSDVTDYSFRMRIYVEGEPVQEEEANLSPGEDKDDDDGNTSLIPNVSVITSIVVVAVIALRRRY